MTVLVVVFVVLALVGSVALARWIADEERWEERAEEARMDRHVRRSGQRLHCLTGEAFASMLEVTHRHPSESD